jgi:hypothetical protein
MAKKLQSKVVWSWVQRWLKVYWAAMAILALLMLTQYVAFQPSAFAADNTTGGATGNTVSNSTGSNEDPFADTSGSMTQLPFDEYFCKVIIPTGEKIVLGLVAVTIIAAGIMYILSFGNSSGEIGGINTAKTMIIAAITGLMLNLMGSLLLGECGFNLAGWIGKLLPPPG